MKNFALIGAAGYIAPRHMKAIKDTGNRLVAAVDKSDSVGILDSYFPEASFFTEFERFDRHIEKLRKENRGHVVDYVSIASPNYLHDAHIRFALRVGADAICEKPLVLNPWNIDALSDIEKESGKRIYTILQLRLHPTILELKCNISDDYQGLKHSIDLTNISARGKWYFYSWKGDESKSGGIATNIGIHFFDMLTWIFGPARANYVHLLRPDCAGGFLELEKANVRWFLSLNYDDLPQEAKAKGKRTYRCIHIDGKPFIFTEGFADLHSQIFREILNGNGFGIEDSRRAIELVYDIRHGSLDATRGEMHPLTRQILGKELRNA